MRNQVNPGLIPIYFEYRLITKLGVKAFLHYYFDVNEIGFGISLPLYLKKAVYLEPYLIFTSINSLKRKGVGLSFGFTGFKEAMGSNFSFGIRYFFKTTVDSQLSFVLNWEGFYFF